MTHLAERYPDLLGTPPDPDLERLVADLDRVGQLSRAARVPHHADAALTLALQNRAARARQPRAVSRRPRLATPPRGPMILLAAALLGVVIVGGSAVYAGVPLIDQALSWFDAASQRSTGHKLGQEVNLSQSACGWTMTIKRVYADANQVVLGYTVSAPAGRTFNGGFDVRPSVTDAQGRTFPMISGGGTETVNNETGNTLSFDAGAVTDAPAALALHVVAPAITTVERLGDAPAAASPCETYPSFGTDEAPASSDASKTRWVTVTGPFTFDLMVPFTAGHTADLHQALDVGGGTVTLERVVATPIETRFYLRGVTIGAGSYAVQGIAQLTVDGRTVNAGGWWALPDGLTIYSFEPFYDQHGQATLTITPRPDLAEPGNAKIVGGPWSFPFTLP